MSVCERSPRMVEFMDRVSRLYDEFDGEFVADFVIIFMPVDAKVGSEQECPAVHGRFGRFRAAAQ